MRSAPKPPKRVIDQVIEDLKADDIELTSLRAVDPRKASEMVKAVFDREPPLTPRQQASVTAYIARMNGL